MPVYRDKTAGAFVFEFDRRIHGHRVRATKRLPKSWNQAQADAYDRQESARLYAIATGAGGAHHGIEDAVSLYLKHRVPELKSGRNVANELAEVFWAYQGRPLSALADVAKVLQVRNRKEDGSELAPATVKNRIAYLRAACRYAWKHHGLGENDPAQRVTVPKVKNERQVYIDRRQMLELARKCPQKATRAIIRIAFYSGMRISEIERAVVVGGRFVLTDTKNGDPRIIPIHPRIRCCIGYPKQSRFTTEYWFRKARAAVGLPGLHIHDLRHSAASAMINEGVDLYTVGAVLGHRSAASTKRYSHLSTDSLTAAIGKIGKRA
jgi:integrase